MYVFRWLSLNPHNAQWIEPSRKLVLDWGTEGEIGDCQNGWILRKNILEKKESLLRETPFAHLNCPQILGRGLNYACVGKTLNSQGWRGEEQMLGGWRSYLLWGGWCCTWIPHPSKHPGFSTEALEGWHWFRSKDWILKVYREVFIGFVKMANFQTNSGATTVEEWGWEQEQRRLVNEEITLWRGSVYGGMGLHLDGEVLSGWETRKLSLYSCKNGPMERSGWCRSEGTTVWSTDQQH